MKKILIYGLGIIVAIGVIGGLYNFFTGNYEPVDTDATQYDIVTPEEAETEEETPQQIPINQTLTFGNSTSITADSFKLEDNVLTVSMTVVSSEFDNVLIDDIVGFYGFQGDWALNSDADNKLWYKSQMNMNVRETKNEPKQFDLVFELNDTTTPVDLTFFPGDSTGYNNDGATEMDISINLTDMTSTTEFNTY